MFCQEVSWAVGQGSSGRTVTAFHGGTGTGGGGGVMHIASDGKNEGSGCECADRSQRLAPKLTALNKKVECVTVAQACTQSPTVLSGKPAQRLRLISMLHVMHMQLSHHKGRKSQLDWDHLEVTLKQILLCHRKQKLTRLCNSNDP